MLTVLLILMTFTVCKAPEWKSLYVEKAEGIQKYKPLVYAVTWVESKHGQYVWNPKEEAVGWFQIRQVRVDDYNKRTGASYTLEDFYDYHLSEKMFLYYADGKSFEHAARSWNGSGPMTLRYWADVQKVLYNNKNN